MSRFSSMADCTAKKKNTGPRSLDCSRATSTRQTQAWRGQAITSTQQRQQQQKKQHSSSTRATLDSSSTRTPAVAAALLLRAALLCVVAVAARSGKNKIFAAENTKIRVGFQAPGWLSGSGTPSPELLAESRDFDHVGHEPRSSAGANACTVQCTSPPCGPCSRKHEKRPAAKREK